MSLIWWFKGTRESIGHFLAVRAGGQEKICGRFEEADEDLKRRSRDQGLVLREFEGFSDLIGVPSVTVLALFKQSSKCGGERWFFSEMTILALSKSREMRCLE